MARRGLSLRVRVIAVAMVVVAAPIIVVAMAGLGEQSLVSGMRRNLEAAALTQAEAPTDEDPNGEARSVRTAREHEVWLREITSDGRVIADHDFDRGPGVLYQLGTLFFGADDAPTLAAFDGTREPIAQRAEVVSALVGVATSECRTVPGGKLLVCHAVTKRADGSVVYAAVSSRRAVRALYDLRYQLIRLTLGLAPFAVLVAWLLGRGIVKPIRALGAQARARAQDPRAALRLDEQGDAEVHDLAVAFNELLTRLQDRQTKNQTFTADLVHELKSPLSTVRAAADTLQDGNLDKARAERLARALRDAGGRLDAIVTQFLELARAEAGLVGDARERIDLGELTRRVAESTLEKHPDIQLELLLESIEVNVVPHGLDTVIRNLLENAFSFAQPREGEPARVTVNLVRTPTDAELSIVDTGPGIGAQDLGRVFDRFFTSRGRERGTGLGLALVKAIVLAHAGTVEVTSPPGVGATFVVRLPVG